MFRLINNFQNLSLGVNAFAVNNSNLQIVRWRRKPRWLPKAKSKVFKVVPRPVIPEDEKQELLRLYNHYRTQVKSIKRYLDRQYNTRYAQRTDVEQHIKEFEDDFIKCSSINDEWNKKINSDREKRVAEVMERDKQVALERLEIRKAIWEEERLKAEELVRQEKEAVKNFITRENLDEAIERAIANPVDYNFALDVDGTKIHGRESKPKQEEPQLASVKQ